MAQVGKGKHLRAAAVIGVLLAFSSAAGAAAPGEAMAIQIGLDVLKDVGTAILQYSKAAVYVYVRTDGWDIDDRCSRVAYDYDDVEGEWELDASEFCAGLNSTDDGNERPYTPGFMHWASMSLHFRKLNGVWEPNPNKEEVDGKSQEYRASVWAAEDDDPEKEKEWTFANTYGFFSADGSAHDWEYQAKVGVEGGREKLRSLLKVSPGGSDQRGAASNGFGDSAPAFAMRQAAAFLVSPDAFGFDDVGGDLVRIRPLFSPTVDLFHCYLQRASNMKVFPVLRGYTEPIQQMKREAYQNRFAGTEFVLSESLGDVADFTIVGAALNFAELVVPRAGRTKMDVLAEYFASGAVGVGAPEHAQTGYVPRVVFRSMVSTGQDISAIIGRDFVIPRIVHPDTGQEKRAIGVLVGVEGWMDEAVTLAVNTDGHFARDSALAAWDGQSETVTFRCGGESNFHTEVPYSLEDMETASPQGPELVCRKNRPDGTPVTLDDAFVTAAFPDFFYVEATDRSNGIRVDMPGHILQVGQMAHVDGILMTNPDDERFILANLAMGMPGQTLRPLGMNNRSLGGSSWEYDLFEPWKGGQRGVLGGTGLNNIGLLVKAFGRVITSNPDYFTIDDGSRLLGPFDPGVRVWRHVPAHPPTFPLPGQYLAVTGISSCYRSGHDLYPQIRIRKGTDVKLLQ